MLKLRIGEVLDNLVYLSNARRKCVTFLGILLVVSTAPSLTYLIFE